jgi:hypothetical protein
MELVLPAETPPPTHVGCNVLQLEGISLVPPLMASNGAPMDGLGMLARIHYALVRRGA